MPVSLGGEEDFYNKEEEEEEGWRRIYYKRLRVSRCSEEEETFSYGNSVLYSLHFRETYSKRSALLTRLQVLQKIYVYICSV